MATHIFEKRSLSIPELSHRYFSIVYSEWNKSITEKLLEGAKKAFYEYGIQDKRIMVSRVPGAYEVPIMVKHILHKAYFPVSGIVALGCVIKGETNHDEYINHAVAQKLMDLSIQYCIPITYGMVTTFNITQAEARISKGYEAALSLLYLLDEMNKVARA
ncbi:MAG: 6,7-dimethyl-8-ribityllumazine synthase [Bacteroidia bacterium]|nr:6,7-dimethyl-8-ribityllumazine synthase [Bacteroidia bacterium]MDW8301013.1 6,7-dimethyl-8-ribityllumazine synthase [Bacteroidia bacterium]